MLAALFSLVGSFLLFEPVELEKLPNAVERTEPPSPREVGGERTAGVPLIGRAVARVMGVYSRAGAVSEQGCQKSVKAVDILARVACLLMPAPSPVVRSPAGP